jgi:hypothetical protein
MNEEQPVYDTKYRRYSTNALLDMLMKLDRDSELHLFIMLILRGRNCSKEYFSKESKLQLERERSLRQQATRISFGVKNEEYCTEEEMITGYVTPSYSELSPEEKKLYDYDDEEEYPENYFNPKTKEDGI